MLSTSWAQHGLSSETPGQCAFLQAGGAHTGGLCLEMKSGLWRARLEVLKRRGQGPRRPGGTRRNSLVTQSSHEIWKGLYRGGRALSSVRSLHAAWRNVSSGWLEGERVHYTCNVEEKGADSTPAAITQSPRAAIFKRCERVRRPLWKNKTSSVSEATPWPSGLG